MKPQEKRLSVNDLEQMTTHQIADLLANIVLLLRRLPDVPIAGLKSTETPADTAAELLAKMRGKEDKKVVPSWLEAND